MGLAPPPPSKLALAASRSRDGCCPAPWSLPFNARYARHVDSLRRCGLKQRTPGRGPVEIYCTIEGGVSVPPTPCSYFARFS